MRRLLPVLAAVALLTACEPTAVAPEPSSAPTPTVAPTEPAPTSVTATAEPGPTVPSVTVEPAPTGTTPPPSLDTRQVEITWYGSWDNDPKGSTAIDRPVLHQTAGGTGTWADPLTFASPAGNGAYAYGTRIYVPSVEKYFLREDSCETSWTAPDGCGAVSHVDLYIGNPSGTKDVLKCEDQLTPDGNAPIIVEPPAGLAVDETPLWDQKNRTCHVLK